MLDPGDIFVGSLEIAARRGDFTNQSRRYETHLDAGWQEDRLDFPTTAEAIRMSHGKLERQVRCGAHAANDPHRTELGCQLDRQPFERAHFTIETEVVDLSSQEVHAFFEAEQRSLRWVVRPAGGPEYRCHHRSTP